MTHELRLAWMLVAVALGGLAIALTLGIGYASRHSHEAGFFRVHVLDPSPSMGSWTRPRHTAFVVIDGLGHLEAEHMHSFDHMRALGQCRTTDVGTLSVSRPVYAVISTGLEQDRTGVRANDPTTPIAAESIWEVARRAGMRVSAVTELPWWRELFPRGFDDYVMPPRDDDYMRAWPIADLQLVHPIYVDEAGHESGASSRAYGSAVRRVDDELEELIDALDLSLDLLVVTADHGQALHGGHGGRQDRVARVRTCFAGRGVRVAGEASEIPSTLLAPSLALLLGLRFPADMRAGQDSLDTLFEIADESTFPPGYFDSRRTSIDRFRAANASALQRWDPASGGSWFVFREHAQRAQLGRALAWMLLLLPLMGAYSRALRRQRASVALGIGVGIGMYGAVLATQWLVRGSFDLTSVSTSAGFIEFTLGIATLWSVIAAALLVRARRSVALLMLDWMWISSLGTLMCVAHPVAFGWRVGYPAPSAELFFFPYFVTLVLCPVHLAGVMMGALVLRRERNARHAARWA